MKDKPLVSIITPSFNQGKFIRETIESVLQQDYDNIEYIVNDGGSTDNTVSILEEYGDRITWVSERDGGQTDAINKGIRIAKGEIIAYLNSDDIYLPGTIPFIVEQFKKNQDVDFLYGDFHAIGIDGTILDQVKTIPFDADILLFDANYISQPASFYRKRLFDKIGLFDDTLNYLMDYEFFLRSAKNKNKMRLVKRYLSAIRYHGECKTLTGATPWAKERRSLKAHYVRPSLRGSASMKFLSVVFRIKRYMFLITRGRLDFMNLKLAYKINKISK